MKKLILTIAVMLSVFAVSMGQKDAFVDSDYILWVCTDCNILGEGELANHTRYINHSNNPNSRIVSSTRWKKARIEVLEKIKAGEEIFIDYGPEYWQAKEYNSSEEMSSS